MAGKRPFSFKKDGSNSSHNNGGNYNSNPNPNPNRGFEGKNELKNEWSVSDGPFRLHAKLTKAVGYIETGIINKKKLFNARLHVDAMGGEEIASLKAFYQSKSGKRPIKQINNNCFDAEFDVPTDQFVGTHLKVTVECKFKIGILRRKLLTLSVFLPH